MLEEQGWFGKGQTGEILGVTLPFSPHPKAHPEVPHPPPAGTSQALPGARDGARCGKAAGKEGGQSGKGHGGSGVVFSQRFPDFVEGTRRVWCRFPDFSSLLARWRQRDRSDALGAAGAHGPGDT